jgi:hypothetical protein
MTRLKEPPAVKTDRRRFMAWTAMALVFGFLTSCILAAPAIVRHFSSSKEETAIVQIPARPIAVYTTALKLIEQNPEIELVKKDDQKLLVEAKKGNIFASVKANPANSDKTQLVIMAETGGTADKKELALRIATKICDQLGVKYTIVEL